MSQAGFTPIQLYYSTTAAAAPSAGNLANGELAVNITDGKLFYKDTGGAVRVLATAAGSAGDVVGPVSSTDNALVRFDGTTGKLVQSSVGVLDDSGNLTGIAALTTSGALTLNGGTANGVTYLNGSKVLTSGSALTFTGVNLGIGTSSPSYRLHVRSNTTGDLCVWGTSTRSGFMYVDAGGVGLLNASGGGEGFYLDAANNEVAIVTNSNIAATFNASGNLGLGVTPSAWGNGVKAIDVGAGSAFFNPGSTAQTWIYNNAYDNSGAKYKNTAGGAAWYQMVEGQHAWYTAPPGTAGNAISFTQAMTLDASGNLAIGATSAAQALHVARGSGVSAFSTFRANGAVSGALFGQDASNNAYCWNESNALLRFGTNNTERARIDSSGNFIHQVNGTAPTLSMNSTMSFELTSNTSLKIVVRGTDGVTRSATLTLA